MRVTKKNLCWFSLPIAVVLSSISISAPLAENLAFQQSLSLYTLPANNPSVTERKRIQLKQNKLPLLLQKGTYGNLEDFTVKAHLTFKAKKLPVVMEALAFTFEPSVATRGSEWRNEGELFWRSDIDARSLSLALPLASENGAKQFPLGTFNEFWLDYTSLPGLPLCVPEMNFQFSILPYTGDSKTLEDRTISTGNSLASLEDLLTIDATRVDWKEREYGYLGKRVLGLAPDEDWHYVQSKNNALMQRRLHVQLDNVEMLDIAVEPGEVIDHINLMVGQKDNYRAGELVEFGNPQSITLIDGRQGVRLNLREALENRFAEEWAENVKELGKHHFYLQEIFIYFIGEARAIAKKKPVKSLVFLGDSTSKIPMQKLASRVIGVNTFRQRMVVDLHKLSERGETNLKSAELLLLPPEGTASCAIRIKKIQAVSTFNTTIPEFAHQVKNWGAGWIGGMLNLASSQYGQVESPGIIEYFPFHMLAQSTRQDSIVETAINRVVNKQLQSQLVPAQVQLPLYSILGLNGEEIPQDKMRLNTTVGVTLRAEGAMPRVTYENEFLVLEGRSRELEISWPLTAHINDKTWFYLRMGGGFEQIARIILTFALADGSVVQREIVPNQPLRLLMGDVEVRNVRLRILPASTPYHLFFHEMALLAPAVASYAEAFTIPLPKAHNVSPKIAVQTGHASVLEIQPGHVSGVISNKPLHFSSKLNPVLDWVNGLQLNYRLPQTYIGKKACSLSLQFNWANGKTQRKVCFENSINSLYIPIANFIEDGDKPQNLGALRSIDWVLPGKERGAPEFFEVRFSVHGWAMLSAADYLRFSPLFNAGRYPFFVDAEYSNEAATGYYERKISLPIEDKALPRMFAARGQIQPAEHWLFTLDRVLVEPSQSINLDRWSELTKLVEPSYRVPKSLHWPKWLAWFSLMFLAWATWKKGWWSPVKAWTLGKGSVKVLIRTLSWVLVVSGRWGWQALPSINLAIGLLALGPGLLLAGSYGSSFLGIMLLAASVLVAWGAYCHWREQTGQHWPEENSSMRARFGVLAVALCCAIWSLGQHKLSIQLLWGFLPLLGAIYSLLPVLYRLGLSYRGYVMLGVWLVLALVLNVDSLLGKVGSGGENYFFNFGALALLFALRAGLLVFEPFFRRLFPAVAQRVYGRAGSLYFSGMLVMLVAIATVFSFMLVAPRASFSVITEQLAIVAYYCLVIGTIQAVWALRKGDKKTVEIPSSE